MYKRLFLSVLLVSGLGAFAQEYPHFNQWMKNTDQAGAVLRKMDKKVGPQAVRAAEVMGGIYEEMIGFFRQYGGQNAVQWSEDAKAAAGVLATAAYSGDAERAEEAFKTLNATCRSCHTAYRERGADGKYRFKQRTQAQP